MFPLELVGGIVEQDAVKVVAAQVRVTIGADDVEDTFGHIQDRDVEGPAAEVEDHDLLSDFPVQPVGQRRGGRLVDNPHDFQPGDLPGILGRLALSIVEIGRDGNHRLVDLVAQVGFRGLFELP